MHTRSQTLNVMFTSVGRRVELVNAFREAYAALGLSGNIVGTDIDRLAPAYNLVDRPHLVPRTNTLQFMDSILDICRAEKVDLVFPLTDYDIPVLAAHKEQLREAGTTAVVVDPGPAAITGDKLETNRFFADLGLAVGRCWEPERALAEEVGFPLFLKPRQGSASQHIHRINSPEELAFYLPRVPKPLLQEYLSGYEVTNDVICSLRGEVLAVVSRRRIEVRWGEVQKGVTVHDPVIQEGCLAVARGLAATGPITVQCIMVDGTPYFTEVNARYGGGAPLGIAAGVNSPLWLLAEAAGMQVDIPPLGTYRQGLHMSRYDTTMFLV